MPTYDSNQRQKNNKYKNINYSEIGKTIAKGALKTAGWITSPGVMGIIEYCNTDDYDFAYNDSSPFAEMGIFLAATAVTMGITFGTTIGYNKLANKEYSTKDIAIEVKHNPNLKHNFWGIASYASPLTTVIMLQYAEDITSIKTSSLEITVENTNIIMFDKEKGFSINKDAYNSNFTVKKIAKGWGEENDFLTYSPSEVKRIENEYQKLKQKSAKIRENALNSGNIGKISSLKEDINKLKNDYEGKQVQLKKIKLELEKDLTDIINQLNTEYTTYKNEPLDTAIPGRDYNLSDIKEVKKE